MKIIYFAPVLLSSFIRLGDYLIVNTMHILAINSVSTLLTYLTDQVNRTPSSDEIAQMQLPIPDQLPEDEAELTLAERKEIEKVRFEQPNFSGLPISLFTRLWHQFL